MGKKMEESERLKREGKRGEEGGRDLGPPTL